MGRHVVESVHRETGNHTQLRKLLTVWEVIGCHLMSGPQGLCGHGASFVRTTWAARTRESYCYHLVQVCTPNTPRSQTQIQIRILDRPPSHVEVVVLVIHLHAQGRLALVHQTPPHIVKQGQGLVNRAVTPGARLTRLTGLSNLLLGLQAPRFEFRI